MACDVSDLDEPPSGTRKLQARQGLLAHVVPRRYLSDCGQRANQKVVLTERYYIQLYHWCQPTIISRGYYLLKIVHHSRNANTSRGGLKYSKHAYSVRRDKGHDGGYIAPWMKMDQMQARAKYLVA